MDILIQLLIICVAYVIYILWSLYKNLQKYVSVKDMIILVFYMLIIADPSGRAV